MKRTIFLLLIAGLLLTGCNTIPQQDPIDTNAPASTVCTTTEPTHTGPLFVKDYLDPKHSDWSEIKDYEVMIPEDGVLILTDQEAIRQVYIEGDVYITATADVSFEDVVVTGKVYCHGRLTGSNYSHYSVYAYCAKSMKTQICSHFDGIHGLYTMEPGLKGSCSPIVSNNALDYAFKTWGNFGPATEIPEITVFKEQIKPQVIQHGDSSKLYPDVYIFTGNGLVRSQKFRGDVYITADAVAFNEPVGRRPAQDASHNESKGRRRDAHHAAANGPGLFQHRAKGCRRSGAANQRNGANC